MSPIRFAIVGAGRGGFAGIVAENLPNDMTITAVCDIRGERAEKQAARFGASFWTEDYTRILERDEVDAVVIATPDHLHAEMAAQALVAEKHVLSEIPMAYTLPEIERIIALAERTGRKYMMGNEVRWFPALEELKRMGERGYWGNVFYGEGEYLHNLRAENWTLIEADGTPHWRFDATQPQTTLLGGGPHAFDALRWLAGETQFTEVFAYGVGEYVPGHPEPATAIAVLKGVSGAAYKVTVSYVMERPYCLYFSLYGSEGTFEGGRTNQSKVFYQSKQESADHGLRLLDAPYWNHPGVALRTGHGTSEYFMMKDFVEAIRENRPPAIDAIESARSIAPAICAFESIRTGKPVTIPQYG
jgi:predicted dehydrogenase